MNSQKLIKTYREWLFLAILFSLSQALFSAVPAIDLKVSSFFWSEQSGFWLSSHPGLNFLRRAFQIMTAAMFIASIAAWICGSIADNLERTPLIGIPTRIWSSICILYAVGPLILVNGILKSFSGRARPSAIVEFGGTGEFTPAMHIADQCKTNCSFVSGEGAGAVAFCMAIFAIARHPPLRSFRIPMHALGISVAIAASFLRVANGRHFLSDVVFSALIVIILASLINFFLIERANRNYSA